MTTTNTSDERWAWVGGASDGLGLAFANELAKRGYALMLFARRGDLLDARADEIRAGHGVPVATRVLDLGGPELETELAECLASAPPDIGIYNAAFAPMGPLLAQPVTDLTRVVDVNIRAPLIWMRMLGEQMAVRGTGGLVLMSSLAGEQGAPNIAAYAASKAFNTILAEGAWCEFKPRGVNVLVCCAGAIRTPAFDAATVKDAPGTLDASVVAVRTLDTLDGSGAGPRVVPGWVNRVAGLIIGRWLPRRWAIAVMAGATDRVTGPTAGMSRE